MSKKVSRSGTISRRRLLASASVGAALAASAKDRHEHQLVVETIRAALEPLCDKLTIAAEPELSHTAAVWHLCTPITARLRDTSTTAIDLALALHPTPAVGGVPTKAAVELIAELEGDRGFYAGAVGYLGFNGDMDLAIAIRTAVVKDGMLYAQAGAGIVADSVPDNEWMETLNKARAVVRAAELAQARFGGAAVD